jgi:hypothetical protein
MRVMVMVKASKDSETGAMPGHKLLAERGKFNQELINAGVLVGTDAFTSKLEGQACPVFGTAAHGHRRPLRSRRWKSTPLLEATDFAR